LDQEALAVDLGMNMLTALEASGTEEEETAPSEPQLDQ
ncbi:putative edge expressed protein, partial [Toxoplasma gondii RUB]